MLLHLKNYRMISVFKTDMYGRQVVKPCITHNLRSGILFKQREPASYSVIACKHKSATVQQKPGPVEGFKIKFFWGEGGGGVY